MRLPISVPPPWLRAAGAVAALVIGLAWLAETAAAPEIPLDLNQIAQAAALSGCVLVAIWLPLTGVVLAQALVLVPSVFTDHMDQGGGAWLIGLLVLVAHLAYRRPLAWALAGYLIAAVIPSTTIVLDGEDPWEFIFFPLILGPGFLVGMLLRREQARSAELARLARELAVERELRAHSAVVEERARISRELHDAVAHTVSVMTLQTGVVRRRLASRGLGGTPEHDALASVEELGRQSVDELRRVVGLLRETGPGSASSSTGPELAPRASLAGLEALALQTTAAGTPVSVEIVGVARDLAPALDMSAFRIIQEALSNTMRHGGPGTAARVTLTWSASLLSVRIVDDGQGLLDGDSPSAVAGPQGGHGLVGMRERTEMFGGQLRAGPGDGGGFSVEAELPLAESFVKGVVVEEVS